MADNVELNPGTGGPLAATDDVGGVHFQRVKLDIGGDGLSSPVVGALPVSGSVSPTGTPVAYWPTYGAPTETGNIGLSMDSGGALVARSAVLTDEGTFRANFANASLAVAIGSVTISGAVVTGAGFAATDVHWKDYFKLDADAESAWVQIASIDSDTQLTLVASYVGGASGPASRALVRPITGTGGSITVASGQALIASGTTSGSVSGIYRAVDYGPLVFRERFSVSQRIANQSIRIGMVDGVGATPKWFARFKLEGAVNTTLVCESGRNPTGAPSASETESTTITVPFGLTTAALLDYRIEQLTESIRFYINGVVLAEHSRSLPTAYDFMTAATVVQNTAAVTTTTVTVDYLTVKNHNKLEVGVMSDSEQIVAAAKPLQAANYSVAGVIGINTDILIFACSQLRSISLQATSIGTTGRLDFFLTNDLSVVGTAQPAYPIGGGAGVTTTTAAGMWTIPTNGAAFLRVRMGVATTAGTTTIFANGSQSPTANPSPTIQSVSLAASANRVAFVAGAGIWFDDSAVALAGAATFTGTSRDLTVTATATAMANAATYAKEMRVSAESDQSGTLWVEFSRDNTNWRRAKSAATAAVTGGGQFAEIIFRPSWRYARVGFTNGATLQTRFSIGSILIAG
jgi:hypothetical protein